MLPGIVLPPFAQASLGPNDIALTPLETPVSGDIPKPVSTLGIGAYKGAGSGSTAGLLSFETYLSKKLEYVSDWPPAASWADLASQASFYFNAHAGKGRRLVFWLPLATVAESLVATASGAHDANIRAVGNAAMSAGLTDVIFRLGAKHNTSYVTSSAGPPASNVVVNWDRTLATPTNWINAFRHVHDVLSGIVGNKFEFAFSPAGQTNALAADVAYPGDAYVDIIAMSLYNQTWNQTNRADPVVMFDKDTMGLPYLGTPGGGYQTYGLLWLTGFGQAHGKPVGLAEYGTGFRALEGTYQPGGGDDPLFIQGIADWAKEPGHNVKFINYVDYPFSDYHSRFTLSSSVNGGTAPADTKDEKPLTALKFREVHGPGASSGPVEYVRQKKIVSLPATAVSVVNNATITLDQAPLANSRLIYGFMLDKNAANAGFTPPAGFQEIAKHLNGPDVSGGVWEKPNGTETVIAGQFTASRAHQGGVIFAMELVGVTGNIDVKTLVHNNGVTAPFTLQIPTQPATAQKDELALVFWGIDTATSATSPPSLTNGFEVIAELRPSSTGQAGGAIARRVLSAITALATDISHSGTGDQTLAILATFRAGVATYVSGMSIREDTPPLIPLYRIGGSDPDSSTLIFTEQADPDNKFSVTSGGSWVLEAESGTITDPNGNTVVKGPGATDYRAGALNGSYVDFGAEAGDKLALGFSALTTGNHKIAVRYANGGTANRPLSLVVNGGAPITLTFPVTGAWDTWGTYEATIPLVAGANTLEFIIPTGATTAPNLDRVTISELSLPTVVLSDSLNAAVKTTHSLTVRATDPEGNTYDEVFTFTVTPFVPNRRAPSDILLTKLITPVDAPMTIQEGVAVGTDIFAISGTDPEGQALTFTEVADPDGKFSVVGTNVRLTAALNFSIKTSHSLTLRATDTDGMTFDKTFTVIVGDDPSAPATTRPVTGAAIGNSLSDLTAHETWLGRSVNTIQCFSGWSDYNNWISVAWIINNFKSKITPTRKCVISIPLVYVGGTLDAVANGTHNTAISNMATQIKNALAGTAQNSIVVRTGWEFNLARYPWTASGGKETVFKNAFRKFVERFRVVDNTGFFKFNWCPNIEKAAMTNPELAYPGDDVVDYIGMDFYQFNQWDGTDGLTAWNRKKTIAYGLQWHVDFANAHSKLKCYDEWGIQHDNMGPYITEFRKWVQLHNIAYHCCWENNSDYPGLMRNGQYPNAGASYKTNFGP